MKNKKVKIDTKYDKLTKEEISSKQSFSNVHQNYMHAKPGNIFHTLKHASTVTKTIIVTTTVAVVSFGTWKYISTHTSSSQNDNSVTRTTVQSNSATTNSSGSNDKMVQKNYTRSPKTGPYVHPPVKGVDVPYKTYKVDANKANTIVYNKSKIKIPAKAFCDANGKEVTGKVDIKYREFHNPVDFFVSGIPMTYDSAGQQYIFESAGMMDIQGYKDGKPVNIKADKTLQVEMASAERDIHYNIYQLDTSKKNWQYVSKSNNIPTSINDAHATEPAADKKIEAQTEKVQNSLASIKKEEETMEKKKPMQPIVYADYSRVFNIDADKKEFPELAVYKNVLFEVDKSDKTFNPAYTKYTWEDASLNKGGDASTYTFTVKRASETHSFVVHPVFDQKDYSAAMKEYDKKFHDYQTALNTKVEQEKKEEQEFTDLQRKQKEAEQRWQDAMARQISAQSTTSDIVSFFAVNKFGIYNCDHPGGSPVGAELAANYTDKSRSPLNAPCVYLVERGRNALFTYYPGANFKFNPKARNFAWCVNDSNQVAIYSAEEFKIITQTKGSFTFEMAVFSKRVETMEDIKALFKDYM